MMLEITLANNMYGFPSKIFNSTVLNKFPVRGAY